MALQIKNLFIDPPLALAPMVGLSHSALRLLTVQLGGVGLLFTEMLSTQRLPTENEKSSPFLSRNKREEPLFYQIYTAAECALDSTVECLLNLNAQGIDLNLGCPSPKLRKMGAGQFMVDSLDSVQKVVRSLRKATDLPLSSKIRVGEKPDAVPLLELCSMLENEGIDLITIHARLYDEKFCRKPRWQLLEPITKKLSVPVLANGGIFSVNDARRCLEISGASGLMIGRGAACRPWIFRDIAKELFGLEVTSEVQTKVEVYLHYVSLLKQRFSPERRLGRLKQFTHYYAATFPYGHHFAARIQASKSLDQATERALEFFHEAV